jgi:hypothetical protein
MRRIPPLGRVAIAASLVAVVPITLYAFAPGLLALAVGLVRPAPHGEPGPTAFSEAADATEPNEADVSDPIRLPGGDIAWIKHDPNVTVANDGRGKVTLSGGAILGKRKFTLPSWEIPVPGAGKEWTLSPTTYFVKFNGKVVAEVTRKPTDVVVASRDKGGADSSGPSAPRPAGDGTNTPLPPGTQPSHEKCTAAVWGARAQNNHREVVTNADTCLNLYLRGAEALQAELTAKNRKVPEGAVSDAEKEEIFRNSLLNDAATCAFLKGEALEALGERAAAIKAHELASRLTHARCWNADGFFWCPAKGAADRLDLLK